MTTRLSNATVRMIARVTIAGEAVRIRLDNTFGTAPLVSREGLSSGSGFRGGAGDGFESTGVLQQVRAGDRSGRRQRHERSGADARAGAAGPGGESAHSRTPTCGRANTAPHK